MVERFERESFWFDYPGFADGFVWCEALEGLQSSAEVVSVDEVGEMPAELVVGIVVVRWPRSAGQVGGEDKLFPGSDYAANFRLDAVAGAGPGDGVEPIS